MGPVLDAELDHLGELGPCLRASRAMSMPAETPAAVITFSRSTTRWPVERAPRRASGHARTLGCTGADQVFTGAGSCTSRVQRCGADRQKDNVPIATIMSTSWSGTC
jgi:hypothetical protein